MRFLTATFLLMATLAGILGFGLIPFAAPGIARLLFFVFHLLFLASVFRRTPRAGGADPVLGGPRAGFYGRRT